MMSERNVTLSVKTCFSSCKEEDHFLSTFEVVVPGTEHNLVVPILPIEFPWRFEELEEFADNVLLRGTYNDAYHPQRP